MSRLLSGFEATVEGSPYMAGIIAQERPHVVGVSCRAPKYNTMPDERVELRDLFNAARVHARAIVETCA
jgi:hypothetical protein